jgi:hypothetical protein
MNEPNQPRRIFVTAQPLAEEIPLPASYFLRLARRCEVPHCRVGRRILFDPEEVVAPFKHITGTPRR